MGLDGAGIDDREDVGEGERVTTGDVSSGDRATGAVTGLGNVEGLGKLDGGGRYDEGGGRVLPASDVLYTVSIRSLRDTHSYR